VKPAAAGQRARAERAVPGDEVQSR
jgi:hypothetical protein